VERTILNTSRVAVAGLGLLGGSIAKRLTRIGARSVFGIARRTEVLQAACDADILEAGSDNPAEILPVVDLTVICLPLTASVAFIKQHAKSFRAGSLVTDVGSVKGSVVREVRDLLFNQGVYFIGSHPMAGSEKSGLEHSDADLYQDRIVFLTPTEDDEPEAVELLRIFWDQMGAQVYELPANCHDAAVSRASHVPHLLSSVLVSTVLDDGDVDAQRLACAGGFRDVSRIAAAQPQMWLDIFRHNKQSVLETLDAFDAKLQTARAALENENWDALEQILSQARDQRCAWFDDFSSTAEPETGE